MLDHMLRITKQLRDPPFKKTLPRRRRVLDFLFSSAFSRLEAEWMTDDMRYPKVANKWKQAKKPPKMRKVARLKRKVMSSAVRPRLLVFPQPAMRNPMESSRAIRLRRGARISGICHDPSAFLIAAK
nr:putative integron gene cassette protein [uncultured bacterium]